MSMQLTIFEHSITEKRCAQCKEVKLIVNFAKNKAKKDGFNLHCSQCRKVYYENNKKVIAQNSKVYYQNNKQAQQLNMKVNYENNKELRKQQSRDYKKKNQDARRQYDKIYYKNNKKAKVHYAVLYEKQRRLKDPLYRLIRNLRARVSYFCKSVNMQKNWRMRYAMGCTREEFKEYFESLFTEGMTWDNYGAWHVDHIKPISLAKTEQEAKELNHHTNLQPLWAEDNIRKSNKYE